MNVAPTIPVDKQMTPRQQGPGYTYGIVLGNRASCLSDEHPARSLWEVDTGRKGAAGHRDSGRRAPETCAPFLGQQGGARSSAFRGLCSGYRNPVSCGRRRRSGLGRTKGGFVRAAVGRPASAEGGAILSRAPRMKRTVAAIVCVCVAAKQLKPEPARPVYQHSTYQHGSGTKEVGVQSCRLCMSRGTRPGTSRRLGPFGGLVPDSAEARFGRTSECSPITRPHVRLAVLPLTHP